MSDDRENRTPEDDQELLDGDGTTAQFAEPDLAQAATETDKERTVGTDDGVDTQASGNETDVRRAAFVNFAESGATRTSKVQNISLLMDVELNVRVEIGHARRKLRDILEFVPGSILELDKTAGEPIDIFVNNQLMAIGEVVVVEEKFGVRIMEILDPAERLKRLDE